MLFHCREACIPEYAVVLVVSYSSLTEFIHLCAVLQLGNNSTCFYDHNQFVNEGVREVFYWVCETCFSFPSYTQ